MAEGASPISSGGAGTVFEYRAAALDLVALLCCVPVPGLEAVPDAVELQKASMAPLDDVVVSNGKGPYLLVLERQIKRTLEIVPSAKAWKGLISQCLESLERFGDDVDAERRRFGVTATGPSKDLEELRELAATAAAQASLEKFLQEALPPLGGQYHRVWKHLKTTVTDAMTKPGGSALVPELVELTAFRIVRRLVVQIEPEGPGARYTALCAALEERLIPAGADYDAPEVFRIIEDLAEEWGPRSGSVDREMLRNRLSAKGLVLRGDPPARRDLEAVEEWTDDFLSRPQVKDRLGGNRKLDRVVLRAKLASTIDAHKLVLVTGPAGTGKSALTRAVAGEIRQQDQVTVVGFSLTDHTWRTVADIDGDLGGPGRLATALRGAPTGRRVFVIDGAEQALSDDGNLLRRLLSLLPRDEEGEPLWHVVAVAREQAADDVSECLAARGGRVETMRIGGLSDAELREVLDAFPALAPMERLPRPTQLLRTLYTVDLLVRRPDLGANPQQILGEEDVADFVYDHLVRRGGSERPGLGHPDDRSDVYLDLSEAVVVNGQRFARLPQSGTGPAKYGLVSDGILKQKRSELGFAHDAVLDYAVAFLLCEESAPAVAAVRQPRRLLRGIRIAAQLRLARGGRRSPAKVLAAWRWITTAAQELSELDGARWQDLPFEALFELGHPEPVLAGLDDELLADGGRALVTAARLRLRSVVAALPILRFLTLHADDLDDVAAGGALRLLGSWLPAADGIDDDLAARVPHAVTRWFHNGADTAAPTAIALACTAQHLDATSRQLFEYLSNHAPAEVQRVVEDQRLATNLARHEPELLALMAHSIYVEHPDSLMPVPFREGVRDIGWPSRYRPKPVAPFTTPSVPPWIPADAPDPAELGPFGALLTHAPDQGLLLIGQVADAATDAVTRIETERGRREYSLVWALDQGEAMFAGTARSWEWPWAGTLGPGPAIAALAALRRWAHAQAAAGADLGELVQRVLGCGRSIALVAVAAGVLALRARRVTDELDPVLGQSDLWALPSSNAVQLTYAVPLIVLRASAERQDAYREMGRRLTAEHEQRRGTTGEGDSASDGVIAEAALLLDSSNYRIVTLPDGDGRAVPGAVTVPDRDGRALVNEAVHRRRMEQSDDGAAFREFVDRFALLRDAEVARDGDGKADARGLFERWEALDRIHRLSPSGRPKELDAIGPMVAAVVLRSASATAGGVEPEQVRWAANELLSAAAATPCAVTADWDVRNDASDPRGADRSAAVGLPTLLQQADVAEETVRAGVLQLAGSAYVEVRELLCAAITRLWGAGVCTGPGDARHTTVLAALTEMVATAGLTAQGDIEVPRQPFRLPDPVCPALTEGTPFVDLRLVADAAAAAHLAAACDCPHGRAARQLSEALTEHDRLTWTCQSPAMASHTAGWRHTHDAVTAGLALDGDRDRLNAYLTAFDADPRALAGLLRALADQATSPARVRELLAMWPGMLDRFATRGNADLGTALLPLPTSGAPWPPAQARDLIRLWVSLHAARPYLADHLLDVLDAHGPFRGQEVGLVLDVLGDHADAVAVSASRVVPFLSQVLSDDVHRTGPDAERARRLLDALAAEGRQEALRVQHRLEESSGLN
ncbi:hypothetical protein [Streptomyces olivaceus]|uniref:hypothetical protein n=1 Tax=Streptomyces olivaceus TaxID=47716 RepID=UPI001CD0175D|nr:hypothetical protein [Streptomyces olivaceus]MBZ6282686.1 hypothetical protein [Streptomyces olivaceus]